jgi:hypothetical protein
VLWSASSAAAYGGNSLKSDFGGHANFHHHNLDLFWSQGFGICQQLPGFEFVSSRAKLPRTNAP